MNDTTRGVWAFPSRRSLVDSGGYANRQHELDLEIAEDFVGCPHVPAMVCSIFFQSVQIPVFSHGFPLGIPLERWEHWVCHGKGIRDIRRHPWPRMWSRRPSSQPLRYQEVCCSSWMRMLRLSPGPVTRTSFTPALPYLPCKSCENCWYFCIRL